MISKDDGLLKDVLVPVAREGWPFVGIFAGVTVLLFLLADPLGIIGTVLTVWCVYFFRNPERVTPSRDGLLISPADGVVQMIIDAVPPRELDMGEDPIPRISVFMNVFDCHVNRAPCDGRIGKLSYIPGKFMNAALDKASEDNERQMIRIDLSDGRRVAAVQIAGLVARRIVCYLQEDQTILAGERFGLIRFGSRVDVYLPKDVAPLAAVGQRCIAGETVLADMHADEAPRAGEVR
ncbi:MAG: phosphatidylserine decarboxylase family protein [Rhodospirillaceae bacterium]|nr:phosphatidylserine decarboxylase family protein [Rhodospirillaceae bacterium]